MTPAEVPGTSARSFYRQELMLSTVQDTSPMVRVQSSLFFILCELRISEVTTMNFEEGDGFSKFIAKSGKCL